MAQADIDGFRINIDDTLAADIKKVDEALGGIEKSVAGAATALLDFAKAINKIDMSTLEKAGSVANAFDKLKESLTGMKTATLEKMGEHLGTIKKEINGIDEGKLSRAFGAAQTPATGIVQQVSDLVNQLAQIPEQVRAAMTGVSKPIAIETKDEKTGVRTEKQTNEQHSLEQMNATLKQREQEMQRLVELQNQIDKGATRLYEIEQKITALKSEEAEKEKIRAAQSAKRRIENALIKDIESYDKAGGDKRLAELKAETAELEKQKNLQKQSEAKGTTTSGQVDVSVKFNEQALLTALKDIATKLETLFKDIPVSLKKELDLSFFEQKAKELKQMFEGITVPVPKSKDVQTTEGVKHESKSVDTTIAPTNAEVNVKINEKTLKDAKALIEELQTSLQALVEKVGGLPMIADVAFSRMSNGLKDVKRDVDSLKESFGLLDMKNIGFAKTRVVLPSKQYFEFANQLMELERTANFTKNVIAKLEEELVKVKAAEEAAANGGLFSKLGAKLATLSEGDEVRDSKFLQKELDINKQILADLEQQAEAIRNKMEIAKKSGSVSTEIEATERSAANASKAASEEKAKATERNIAGLRAEIKEQKEALREGEGITQAEGKQRAAVEALARSKAELKAQETSLTEQLKKQYDELLKLDKMFEKLESRSKLSFITGGKSGDLTTSETQLYNDLIDKRAELSALIEKSPALLEKEGQALKANYELELLRVKAENERWQAEQTRRYEGKKPTTEKKSITEVDTEKEILGLLKEQLKLKERQRGLANKSIVSLTGLSPEEEKLLTAITKRVDELSNKLENLKSTNSEAYNSAEQTIYLEKLEMEVRLRKELESLLKANNKPVKSAEEIRIENLVKEYKSILSQMQTIEKAQAQANKTLNDKNATQDERDKAQKILTDTTLVYEQLAQRRVEIEQETDDKIVALRNKAAAAVAKAEAQQLRQAQKDREQQAQIDPKSAIEYAKSAKSINDLQTALKNLKKVMGDATPNQGEWKIMNKVYQETKERLDGIKKSMGDLKDKSNSMMPSLKNLAMQLGMVFSVQQLGQWVKHMVEVRAQFELQQIALRSIIQDKQKADEVFAQVQQLAMKSPFSIMQLNTYTKQIAAYGVEADKLVGTTKELADVSAGLGVDMGRLILAYGQVKTANYLRATEVRQFTEAGLNITQELANYFTELNGKMVTAGEVTDMITKRMVKFEDVAEVFHRVTSAGGMFYNMQEKQAEGIHGQMQRIGDAYSIMLNDIGKSNEGVIATTLATIRSLISNWRQVAPVAKAALAAVIAFYSAKGGVAFVVGLKKIWDGFKFIHYFTNQATGAMAKFKAMLEATNATMGRAGWFVIVGAVASLITYLATATDEAEALNEELNRITDEVWGDMADAVGRFRELADIVSDATKSYAEKKEAMDELVRAYGDILPKEELEIEYIQQLAGKYKEAEEAIREYYRTKLYKEEKAAIDKDYQEKIFKGIDTVATVYAAGFKEAGATKQTVKRLFTDVVEEAKKTGMISATELNKAFLKRLQTFYGTEGSDVLTSSLAVEDLETQLEKVSVILSEYYQKVEEANITPVGFNTQEELEEAAAVKQASAEFEKQKEKVDALKNALSALYNLKNQQGRTIEMGGTLTESDKMWESGDIEDVKKAYEALGMASDKTDEQILALVSSSVTLNSEMARVSHTIGTNFLNSLTNTQQKAAAIAKSDFFRRWIQGVQQEINRFDGTPVQQEIWKIEDELKEMYHVNLGTFDWLTTDAKTSFASAAKDIKAHIDDMKEKVVQFKMIASMSIFPDPLQHAQTVTGLTPEFVQNYEKWLEMMTKFWNSVGGHDKENKAKQTHVQDKTEQLLRDRISLLKEANQTYEKYAKEYDKIIAQQKTHNDLMERAKELGIADIFNADALTNAATLDAMQKVYNKYKALFENKKYIGAKRDAMKEMSEMKFQISVELNKGSRERLSREIDKIMGNYQLYVELDRTGVDAEVAKSFFDIDYTTLEDIEKHWKEIFLTAINEQYKQMDSSFKGFATYEEAKQKLSEETENENYKLALDTEKKITEAAQNEYKSRMKEYMKYLKKSYGEAVDLQVDAYNEMRQLVANANMEIALINTDTKKTDDIKSEEISVIRNRTTRMIDAIREEMHKKLGETQWKEFTENPVFENLFADIEKLGTGTIDILLDKIKELKNNLKDLSPKTIKDLVQYEEKLLSARLERNPFSEYIKSLKEIRKLNKEGKTFQSLNKDLAEQEIELSNINDQIVIYEKIISIKENQNEEAVQGIKLTEIEQNLLNEESSSLHDSLNELKRQKNAQEEIVKSTQENLSVYKKALLAQEEATKRWQTFGEIANLSLGAIRAGFEALQHDQDAKSVTEPYIDGLEQIINSVVQTGVAFVALGITVNSALGVIGIVATAVSAIFTAVSAFNKAHDARLENKIKNLQIDVDRLERSFDNLKEAIDNAFSAAQLGAGYHESIENIEAQNRAYVKMINLERQKKDSDADKIRDYENTIEDNYKKIKELREEYINSLGGLATGSDVREAAENFADAWVQAFDETGNGLSGLQDNFKDFIKNIAKKQAYMKAAEFWIKPLADDINSVFDQYGGADMNRLKEIYENFKNTGMLQMDAFLEDFSKMFENTFGISLGDSAAQLSGLAAGIQGVTEETAQVIEALLNSMRFYVADTNKELKNVVLTLTNPPSDNVFLSELKAQTAQLEILNKTLNSLVRAGHKMGGHGLKVFTN